MKPIWQPLDHHLHQQLLNLPQTVKNFLLCVSGGADSTALALAFSRVKHSHQLNLRVVHFHHGDRENLEFRNQSLAFVKDLCQQLELPLEVIKNHNLDLHSEDELRRFRKAGLVQLSPPHNKSEIVVYGHHQNDLMETRLMRLIRGTGFQGLTAMRVFSEFVFRPWLGISRDQIELYLKTREQKFLRDPDTEDLRSWLRGEWLVALEARIPGALQSLAGSLENLSQSSCELPESLWRDQGLCTSELMLLSVELQKQALAQYFYRLGVSDFTRAQIGEVLKHLDKVEIEHKFHLAGLDWFVNAEQITARRGLK